MSEAVRQSGPKFIPSAPCATPEEEVVRLKNRAENLTEHMKRLHRRAPSMSVEDWRDQLELMIRALEDTL